ncbi:MAG: DUF202 domain-containing protein [Acidimicrobiales bacterium]|nr:DUF202 domain-containing protein [Acidimicrobiales bacterium]HRW39895.1 DUF202 domain-containing protein [Aquihabitans sp.]
MSEPVEAAEPEGPYAVELQHERTALAWERTAFSILAVGVVLARFAAFEHQGLLVAAGLAVLVGGATLVAWTQVTYQLRGHALRRGEDVAHPAAARTIGLACTVTCALCAAAGLWSLR